MQNFTKCRQLISKQGLKNYSILYIDADSNKQSEKKLQKRGLFNTKTSARIVVDMINGTMQQPRKALQKNYSTRRLSIYCKSSDAVEKVYKIRQAASHWANLIDISMIVGGFTIKNQNMNQQKLPNFNIRPIRNLQKLVINDGQKIDNGNDLDLLHKMFVNNCRSLKHFTVNFQKNSEGWSNHTFSTKGREVTRVIRKLIALEHLRINYPIPGGEDLDLEKATQPLKKLQTFGFSIRDTSSLSDEKIAKLVKNMSTKPSLTNLIFGFELVQNVGQHTLKEVSNCLQEKKNLEKFTIIFNLYPKTIGNRDVQEMIASMPKQLKQLKLGFSNMTQITENAFQGLSNYLSSASELTELSIVSSWNPLVSQNVIPNIFNGLKKCEKLRKLEVDFEFCINVNDNFIISLGMAIAQSPALEEISISLVKDVNITNHGIKQLLQHLTGSKTTTKNLKKFSFDISYCRKITYDIFEQLLTFIKASKKLERIVIRADNCPNFSPQNKMDAYKTIKAIGVNDVLFI